MKDDSLDYTNIIRDKAIKMEKIDWQKCKWLQPESLKTLMEVDFKKLVKSFKENDSIDPLKVWEEKPGTIWILDGHHRQKVLEYCLQNETKKPPRLMNAIFIDCKDKKEAAKYCLLYATEYAKIQDEGLYEFLHTYDLPFDEIKMEIELPGINLDSFQACYYGELNPGDPGAWTGMPEFNQQDKSAYHSLHVHFKDENAMNEFARTIGQDIDKTTHYLWFPKIVKVPERDKIYE